MFSCVFFFVFFKSSHLQASVLSAGVSDVVMVGSFSVASVGLEMVVEACVLWLPVDYLEEKERGN